MTQRYALGLDMATHTGYALQCGTVLASGVWDFSPRRGALPGQRYADLYDRLDAVKAQTRDALEAIFYEQIRFMKWGNSTAMMAAFEATLQLWCVRNHVHLFGVKTSSLKLFATGNGKATKDDMVKMFELRRKRKPKDDNEADAFHVLEWGLDHVRKVGLCPQSK